MKKLIGLIACLMLFGLSSTWAQSKSVTGMVTDQSGVGLPGVSVSIKGTSAGTSTDIDGKWALSVKSDDVIIISFVGMKSQEIRIGNKITFKIILEENRVAVDEVVVTAMGRTRKKKAIGYASQEVKAEELLKVRTPDLNNALVGKVSGVRFLGGSGAKFDAGSIALRGTTSLDAKGNSPIYVIDGVIASANSLNMDNVEAVNVLKGPAATALYGQRGNNGAIIIKTRSASGEDGAAHIDFTHTTTLSEAVIIADYQNEYGGGYTQKWNTHDGSVISGLKDQRYHSYSDDVSWGPKYDGKAYIPYYAWDKTDRDYGKTTPYVAQGNLKDLFRTGVNNSTNIAFSKAGKGYSTRVSFSNVDWKGVIPNSKTERQFLSIKNSFDLSKKLHLLMNYNYTRRKTLNAGVEGYGGSGNAYYTYTQWFQRDVDIARMKDYKRPDGSFRSWNINSPSNPSPAYHNNPFALFNEINNESIENWSVFNAALSYDITSDLKISAGIKGNYKNYYSGKSVAPNLLSETPSFDAWQTSKWDTQIQFQLSYSKKFFDDILSFDGAAYAEQRDYRYEPLNAKTTEGLAIKDLYSTNASFGKPIGSNNGVIEFKTRSVYGTAAFGFDNTYYIEANVRNDWDSRLPEANNSYLYGSLSTSILLHSFLEDVDFLKFWKIRASVAQVGTSMAAYNVNTTYILPSKFGTQTRMRNSSLELNPNIKPTISTSYEIGTEFRLFNNRVFCDLNYYNRLAEDQILNIDVTGASGFTSTKINAGAIRNSGLEITLGGTPIKTDDFQWDLTINYSMNSNVVEELSDFSDKYRLARYGFGHKMYLYAEKDKSLGTIYGTKFKRDASGTRVVDADGLFEVDSEKLSYLGDAMPDSFGGFNTTFKYKNFALSASFDYQIGGNMLSVSNMWGESSGLLEKTSGSNDKGNAKRSSVANGGGVRVDGVLENGTKVTKYVDASNYFDNLSQFAEEYLYDSSYLKWRDVSLSYNFSKNFLDRTKYIQSARLSFTVNNILLLYSGVPNIDPSEAGGSYHGYIEQGQMAPTRSYALSLNINF